MAADLRPDPTSSSANCGGGDFWAAVCRLLLRNPPPPAAVSVSAEPTRQSLARCHFSGGELWRRKAFGRCCSGASQRLRHDEALLVQGLREM